MGVELRNARLQPLHLVDEMAHFGLNHMRFFPDPRVTDNRLHDLNRHHEEGWRNDNDAALVRLLNNVLEIFVKIGIKRLGWHEQHRDILGLAGQKIALRDIADMFAGIGANPRRRLFARLLARGSPQRREGFERKFRVDDEDPRIARQANDAIGAGIGSLPSRKSTPTMSHSCSGWSSAGCSAASPRTMRRS